MRSRVQLLSVDATTHTHIYMSEEVEKTRAQEEGGGGMLYIFALSSALPQKKFHGVSDPPPKQTKTGNATEKKESRKKNAKALMAVPVESQRSEERRHQQARSI
jgi:hypothetical protein